MRVCGFRTYRRQSVSHWLATYGLPMIQAQRYFFDYFEDQVSSRFDANALSKNAVRSDPAVDSTPIIADLKSLAADGLYEVQIFSAAHSAEHDVSD
jgi:hypothetical protein